MIKYEETQKSFKVKKLKIRFFRKWKYLIY